MSNEIQPLNQEEQFRLSDCEEVIAAGIKSWLDVGAALLEIRDRALYRETHETFRDYCEQRWNMTDRHARRLIQGVGVAETVAKSGRTPGSETQPILTEKHAREIAKAPPEEQGEAWKEAVETAPGGKPTAKHVAEVVNKRKEEATGGGDPPPPPFLDGRNQPIADKAMIESFTDSTDWIREAMRTIARLRKEIKSHEGDPDGAFVRHERIDADLRTAWKFLKSALPYTLCPYCGGKGTKGCTTCHERGWLPEDVWGMVPAEMKGETPIEEVPI